jgi:hypothetical protein
MVSDPLDKFERNKGQVLNRFFSRMEKGDSRFEQLIAAQKHFGGLQDSFAEGVVSHFEGIGKKETTESKYFGDKLKGTILVDLGGARLCRMLSVAQMYRASGYVNVDKYIAGGFGDLPYDPTRNQYEAFWSKRRALPDWQEPKITTNIEPAIVNSDMLDFVSRLPDGSVNFTINGIDNDVLGHGPENEEYARILSGEIIRALRPNGILFGVNFTPIAEQISGVEASAVPLQEHNLDSEQGPSNVRLRVFEKRD